MKQAFKTFETEDTGSGHVSVKELEKALQQQVSLNTYCCHHSLPHQRWPCPPP